MTLPLDTRGERALWSAVLRLAVADALAGDADAQAFLADLEGLAPVCEALDIDPQWFQAQLQQQHPALSTPPQSPEPEPPQSPDPARVLADWRHRLAWLARQCWAPGCHGLSQEDLVQEGVIGLLDALSKYDGRDGNTFATYAEFRITGAMRDALREADPAPRSVRNHQRKARQAEQIASQQLGRAPERAEVAEVLGIALETYDQWQYEIQQLQTLSLDYDTPTDEDSVNLYALLATPETATIAADFRRHLQRVLDDLPSQAQLVLRLYYGEGLSQKTIGAQLGLTESRISQIHTAACEQLAPQLALYVEQAAPPPRAIPRLCYNGEERSVCGWARRVGMHPATLRTRLWRGWAWPQALLTPVETRKKEQ